jgi:hypothetical protein
VGVTQLKVIALGAHGGDGTSDEEPVAPGGRVDAVIPVTPGEELLVVPPMAAAAAVPPMVGGPAEGVQVRRVPLMARVPAERAAAKPAAPEARVKASAAAEERAARSVPAPTPELRAAWDHWAAEQAAPTNGATAVAISPSAAGADTMVLWRRSRRKGRGAGGGGGSSYAEPGATNVHMLRGFKTSAANGLVVFSWQ